MAYDKEILNVLVEIRDRLPEKADDGRFTDNGDGTVTDKKTGLMWQKERSSDSMNHSDAEKYCSDSKVAGHKDWRLPTVKELASLVDYAKYDPAINPLFNCKSACYWTSTPCAYNSDNAWFVNFYGGRVSWDDKSDSYYVRPVRQY